MRVELFDFELPPSSIAQAPAEPRDQARMLRVTLATFEDRVVADLASLLDERDLLVFNDTKVIPARLRGLRGGTSIEILLHRQKADDLWIAFARPAKRLRVDDVIRFGEQFEGRVIEKLESGEILLRFDATGQAFQEALQRHGEMPLPPYIRREHGATAADRSQYQTIYARNQGAVAAPTAGLHFTDNMMNAIEATGAKKIFLTLHVGAGTFQPVKVDDTADHRMHAEWGEISAETADRINEHRQGGGRILAVGTTSLRLLESAGDASGMLHAFRGDTSIFITPGYAFRVVDRLLTNFHLPKSTLFMLVSAFAGMERMRDAYRHAIHEGYRFYSYGDACLLENTPEAA